MKISRFFCSTIDSGSVIISDIQLRHLTKVLRLKKGDTIELFDGKGTIAHGVIENITKDSAHINVQSVERLEKKTGPTITIASSIAKAQRFEEIVARCTELGIDRICPVIFERTVKQAEGEKTLQRFESIAIESCKQCGRTFVPVIDKPGKFKTVLDNLRSRSSAKIIFGSLEKNAESIINIDIGSDDICVFIGPEGGLSQTEVGELEKIQAKSFRITDTILRIETAAIAFAAILTAKRDLIQ
ncbi:MAG: 16S rRNA (uracil(1498)-N(3))-methyltransferase [Sedimentisphaerales bacterium]|nr:16S rRNA (uracil(1498)-N(3))-methyltransferase [Sedimentisphaerales bacterium]